MNMNEYRNTSIVEKEKKRKQAAAAKHKKNHSRQTGTHTHTRQITHLVINLASSLIFSR